MGRHAAFVLHPMHDAWLEATALGCSCCAICNLLLAAYLAAVALLVLLTLLLLLQMKVCLEGWQPGCAERFINTAWASKPGLTAQVSSSSSSSSAKHASTAAGQIMSVNEMPVWCSSKSDSLWLCCAHAVEAGMVVSCCRSTQSQAVVPG